MVAYSERIESKEGGKEAREIIYLFIYAICYTPLATGLKLLKFLCFSVEKKTSTKLSILYELGPNEQWNEFV